MTSGAPVIDEWPSTLHTPGAGQAPLIDVIVPVYGNLPDVLICLRSVMEAQNQTPFELIVIDDASPQEEVWPVLKALGERTGLTLLRNDVNLGFPETCNRGFALHPDRDIIILNSDTEVYGDWIDRLVRTVESDPRIATVTPLTNDGEIASYPLFRKANPLAMEIPPRDLDALAADAAHGVVVEVPTGVGFCMYIRRTCLDEIGYFDAEAFGKGYGEENDLCLRAAEASWKNVIAANVFVAHRGGGSFGAVKQSRIQAALNVLERRHPGYGMSVQEFIERDPLRMTREALDLARTNRLCKGPRFMFITHNWGGGVERHIQELKSLLEKDGACVFLCRPSEEDPEQLCLEGPVPSLIPNVNTPRLSLPPQHFADVLTRLRIDQVHIHNLAGYGPLMSRYLREALKSADVPYDVTLHDYQSFCPQNHLVDPSGYFCGEPDEQSCQWCIETQGSPFGQVAIWEWRLNSASLLANARSVYSPSEDTAKRVARYFDVQATVVSHPVVDQSMKSPAALPNVSLREAGTTRVGLLGAVSTPKGSRVLKHVAELGAQRSLPLRFVVVGTTDIDDLLSEQENVEIVGKYPEGSLDSLIAAADLDAIWFPAVWPETFSYTLSSALATPLPIIAFDFGAVAERLRRHNRGLLLPVEAMLNPESVLEAIMAASQRSENQDVEIEPEISFARVIRDYYGRLDLAGEQQP